MTRFLEDIDLRPLDLRISGNAGVDPIGLALGKGQRGVEIAIVDTQSRPTKSLLQRIWRSREGGRAVPLIVVAFYDEKVAVCGPSGDDPPVSKDLEPDRVERICRIALDQPDRHAALRFLMRILPELESDLPGVKSAGLVSIHELVHGVPRRGDWEISGKQGAALLDLQGEELIKGLGYEIEALPGRVSALRAKGSKMAVALFLERSEAIDLANDRFEGQSPISYALTKADQENLPFVVANWDGQLRLYPVEPGKGVGQRGRADTYLEIHLGLLPRELAAYLWLLLSADALAPAGSLHEILQQSKDFAADVSSGLRERVYDQVVPNLALGIWRASEIAEPTADELERLYEMALTVLFRLLFIAYAEDHRLLPYRTNSLYTPRSLKKKAHELLEFEGMDTEFSADATLWREVQSLVEVIDKGKPEWGVPAYNGGLFSSNPEISPAGASLQEIALPDRAFGPALAGLLLHDVPGGRGPIDFRSLGVREFGTIYEGLLESELSVAETDLAVDDEDRYVPAEDAERVVVPAGGVYLHNASGARKSTGSYYTKSFAVEHLLDQALEPAMDDHFKHLDELSDAEAEQAFFDFRVADIAMGSGHFLVAAVDRMERRFAGYHAERQLPGVHQELNRLRSRAEVAMKEVGGDVQEIDDSELLRRQLARRCIFGVDLNPMAVSLARLALWLHTFVPGLPLSLLDYNLVEGNSLVGIGTIQEAEDVLGTGHDANLFGARARELMERVRDELASFGKIADADAAEIAEARNMYEAVREKLLPVEALFDILSASRIDDDLDQAIGEGAATNWTKDPKNLPGSQVHEQAKDQLKANPPFHFPIAFPQVFLREQDGFNVIVGNPPWDEVTVEEDRFWLRYRPGLQGLPQAEQEAEKARLRKTRPDLVEKYQVEVAQVELVRDLLTSGPYPGMGTGDPDYYKGFVWRFWRLAGQTSGRVGVVLPRTAFSGKGLTEWRSAVYKHGGIQDLTSLLNRAGWVFDDAEHRYTVVLLSFKRLAESGSFDVALRGPYASMEEYVHGIEEEPTVFSADEVLEWTDTGALPLLPAADSAKVFAQLRQAPRLDLEDEESWRARPYRELDATNDKKLKDGTRLMYITEKPPEEAWPVYKGASFDLWQPDTGTYYAWADPEVALQRLQDKREWGARMSNSAMYEFGEEWVQDPATLPPHLPRVAFRDVTNRTNTRTVVVALIPPRVFITNKGPYLLFPRGDKKDEAFLLGVLSSIPLDWYARRFVETTLNFHIFNPFPVPRPDRSNPLWGRTVELSGHLASPDDRFADWADKVGVEHGPVENDVKEDMIHELDAVVAHLYGLSAGQLQHIFETFHEGWDYGDRLGATLGHFQRWEERL